MRVLPLELQPVLDEFEKHQTPLAEEDISLVIHQVVDKLRNAGKEIAPEISAEAMAFDFCEDYQDEQTSWGTYYGPQMVASGVEWPSLQAVTPAMLEYWEQRAKEANHPVLRARYADLAWDLSPTVKGQQANIRCARTAIDSYADAVEGELYEHRHNAIYWMDRSLVLAVSLNDKLRIEHLRDVILNLDATEAPDDDGAGIAFDLLANNKKVQLSEEILENIVAGQEQILARGVKNSEEEMGFPFSVDRAAERLATHYRRQNKHDQVKRVLGLYARAKIAMAKRAAPILGAAWLRDVHEKLVDFGCPDEAEVVAVVLRDLGKKSTDQMIQHTEEIKISKKDVDEWTNAILDGELEDVLRRLVPAFIPDPNAIEKDIKERAKVSSLMAFMPICQVDADGRQVARIGSVNDDIEGRVIQDMGQNLQFEAPFLRHLIQELIVRYKIDANTLLEEIMKSPVFEDRRKETIKRGLEACLSSDHVMAAHLLIPQIEHALRLLAVAAGSSAYKPNRRLGGIQLKTLGDLLRDAGVVRVLGDHVIQYLQVLLTDPRGWNLRNDLFHGILNPDQLGQGSSDRLLHLVILLGSLRAEE
jgi:hypothetical protein